MRTITSLMFSLSADQAFRLNHYAKNKDDKFDLSNICITVPVSTKSEGRHECLIENMDILEDSLTKNISITLHLVDKEGLREAMEKDNRIYILDMKHSPRTNKLSFSIVHDGFVA